jgi:predicted alpha/beta superfamily hydrolase
MRLLLPPLFDHFPGFIVLLTIAVAPGIAAAHSAQAASASASASALAPAASGAQAPPPYVLKDTEVRVLHAARLDRDYELYIGLPPSYAASTQKYPVVFVTDAPYAFPLIRALAPRIGAHGEKLQDFILVGLGYAKGDTPEYSRRRDYTPSPRGDKDAVSDMPGRAPVFGQAEGYRQFVAAEVFPFIAAHYRADMSHKVFAGHSYGSLFGAHVLLTAPAMFDAYVLGSPSLWFDGRLLFAREREYAAAHRDLRANVYIANGSFETLRPQSRDPRYGHEVDMVADTQAFARALASRHYPGLHLRTDVIADEDHLTVAPAIITRGLMWSLGRR